MEKSAIPAIRSYPDLIASLAKSRWMPFLFLFPASCYVFFLLFESQLTNLIIPLFPEEPDKSYGFYNDFLWLCFNEILWYCFFFLTAWIFHVSAPVNRLFVQIENHVLDRSQFYSAFVIGLTFVASIGIAVLTLQQFPNSADEYAYLYQAQTLSGGKLALEAHPLEDFFHFNHIAQKDGLSVGRFPPGWPLLLSLPFVIGFPVYLLNPLLAVVALIVFYKFVNRYYGPRVAIWSLVSLAFTGYYIFNSASFFSHTSCLLFTVAFVYCLYLHEEKGGLKYSFFAGLFLGMVLITRYYTAVLFFLPVLVYFLWRYRWKAVRMLLAMGLGILPFFLFLFWYNQEITGDGFLPVTVWADSEEGLGFVKGHSFTKAIEHSIRRVLLFLYWSSPALLILYLIYLYQKIRIKSERLTRPEDYFILLLFIGYFFYHHLGGNQYGPRFLFEAVPFLTVFVIRRALSIQAAWPKALIIAGILYGVVKLPYIVNREHRVVVERLDLYRLVEKAQLSNAVVLVSTHTSVIRPMPIRDLTRNGLTYDREIIYAQDRREKNNLLMEYYPGRSFYKYVRDPDNVEGRLVKLR